MADTIGTMNTTYSTSTVVGLTSRQRERYSLAELIRAAATDDINALAFYREISDTVAAQTGQQATTHRSIFLPGDLFARDMTVAGVSGSNYIVGTEMPGFAGALYAASITSRLPLRRVALVGNGTTTVATTAATATWLTDEAAEIADAAMVFGSRVVMPKTISTVMFLSKQLDLQAPAAAAFVEQQAAAKLAVARDTAFVQGTGTSGQPLGLLTMTGTTSQSGTSLAYAGVCTMVAAAEGYGGTPHVLLGKDAAKLLRQRAKVTSGDPVFANGTIDGLPTIVSRAMPDDAALVFDPSLVVEATWGALEVVVSPLATPTAFRTGAIGIRLMASVDYVVDHPAAIVKSTSIT